MSRQVVITCQHGKYRGHEIPDSYSQWATGDDCPGGEPLDLSVLPPAAVEAARSALGLWLLFSEVPEEFVPDVETQRLAVESFVRAFLTELVDDHSEQ